MRENFVPSLGFTLGFEGGYVNHPDDPGGHTNKGITLTTLRRYQPGATVADLKAISDEMVRRIYRDGYWNAVKGDTLAAGVDGATFDYGVNSGPAAARKSLMAVIGGPDHETVKKLCARRLSIYQTFKHWKTFGRGWTNRITAAEAFFVAMALKAQNDAWVVKGKLEDEAADAKHKQTQQTTGAGGTGAASGTGATLDPATGDALAGWLLTGAIAAGVLLTAYLVFRAVINKRRAAAYAAQAAEVQP